MRHHPRRDRTVLLTGFEPFGRHSTNSSWEAVRIAGAQLPSAVHVACLPVHPLRARDRLLQLLELHRPQTCLLTGLAAGSTLRIERHARKPPSFDSIPGPARLSGHWPWSEMYRAASQRLGPVRLSDDAGRYVCESTYWTLLAFRQCNGGPRDAAFMHLPPLNRRANAAQLAAVLVTVLDARLGACRRGRPPRGTGPSSRGARRRPTTTTGRLPDLRAV